MASAVLEYTVILHWDKEYGGYWVEVPTLPGCVSQGKSREEALHNVKEAIVLHVESMKDDGEQIPVEESSKVIVEV